MKKKKKVIRIEGKKRENKNKMRRRRKKKERIIEKEFRRKEIKQAMITLLQMAVLIAYIFELK